MLKQKGIKNFGHFEQTIKQVVSIGGRLHRLLLCLSKKSFSSYFIALLSWSFFGIGYCGWWPTLSAQNIPNYEIAEVISTADGLPSNRINTIRRVNRGFLLMATERGGAIYDGYDVQIASLDPRGMVQLSGSEVAGLDVDKEENVWVATNNGIQQLNPKGTVLNTFFNVGNQQYPPLQKGKENFNDVVVGKDGAVWLVHNGFLYKWHEQQLVSIQHAVISGINRLAVNDSGTVFLANFEQLMAISAEGAVLFVLPMKTCREQFPAIFRANFKLTTHRGDVLIFSDVGTNTILTLRESGEIKQANDAAISLGQVLQAFRDYFDDNAHKRLRVFTFYADKYGILWLGTEKGVLKYLPQKEVFQTIPELTGTSCRKLHLATDGWIYGGAYSSFYFFAYQPTTKAVRTYPDLTNVYDILNLNLDTLLLTFDGRPPVLFDLQKQQVVAEASPRKMDNTYKVFVDSRDTIWFLGREDLSFSTKDRPLRREKFELALDHPFRTVNTFQKIIEAGAQRLWLATSSGLFLVNRQLEVLQHYATYQPPPYRLLGNSLRGLVQDSQGNLWIGTENGLNFLDQSTGHISKSLTTEDGLVNNFIFELLLENDSTLWIGTARGLGRYATTTKKFRKYSERDGLAHDEFNTNSYLQTADNIYLGGINGVTIIDRTENMESSTPNFNPFISRYTKFNEVDRTNRAYFFNSGHHQRITLSIEERAIEFFFGNTDFTNPQENTFTCFLEGFDTEWITLTDRNFIRYTNLPHGKYTLHLKTANADGIWSKDTWRVPVWVVRPFYEQTWFAILITFMAMAIIGGFYYVYTQQVNQRLLNRQRIAADLHDEVINSLAYARILAAELRQQVSPALEENVVRIEKLCATTADHVQDTIWTVENNHNSVEDLLWAFEDFLDERVRFQKIPVIFEKKGLSLNQQLEMLLRRNLLLIFKEAIMNALKHTHVTKLWLILDNRNEAFLMRITNEFSAKRPAIVSSERGLANMKKRAADIGGQLIVTEEKQSFEIQLLLKKRI
ncbi:MAG: two-component regulator propeller domain-containing protein [Bacteroidota bacterium]